MLWTLGFGGGCHWCTEAVFQQFRAVDRVEQGFIRSEPPDDSWSEAARVGFDPDRLPPEVLVEAHLLTHASTSDHTMRGKYRSAVYVETPEQERAVRAAFDRLRPSLTGALATRVLPLSGFRASDPRFQNYFAADPDRPFCRTYIAPKLSKLRQAFRREVTSASG
jgi:peptide-methionine (S)-S-oxide reductase